MPNSKNKNKMATTRSRKARTSEENSPSKKQHTEEEVVVDVRITSSKACQAFKKRVDELTRLVQAELQDCVIEVDEQKKLSSKPDKGSFVVQVGDKPVVEMIAMQRPFTAMKALVIADLAQEVIEKVKEKRKA